MALHATPRKVPLASGDDPRPRPTTPAPGTTKRVFFCGVVIEGSEYGRQLPDDIKDFVLSFGRTVRTGEMSDSLTKSTESPTNVNDPESQRKRALTNTSALASVINEVLTSERSYVERLRMLKRDYADPLRSFARNKDTAIIPLYDAKILFGNIDSLIPINEAFLADLEKMMAPGGAKVVGGVGDVALKHFKELRGFELYKQYYSKREDAQLIFERQVARKYFSEFIDRIKYSPSESKNRVGLRELLMEPVQRIPRYTLLFRTMLKHMAMDDPQRPKIIEADEIASKIALAEADEQTKRAAIFYCLSASIDGFPPDLFSNSRRFIDCIDVEDILTDTNVSSSSGLLHCSLFLFDDKLVIVKRPNSEKSGRQLSGLNDLDKVTKGGTVSFGKKKSGLSCKGVVDITDVVATDVGGAEFHLYLESPPQDQTDRWSGRSFRSYSVVHQPTSINFDPQSTETDKQRFLENLWLIQATYRARAGQSVVLCSEDAEVETKYGKVTMARAFYNVYQRTAFLQEQKKTKVVVHIDPSGSADPLPFGMGGPPLVRIRVQPLAGGLARFAVASSDPSVEVEEDIVQIERVPSRVVQTIHQYGLFQFRTGKNSLPTTPTARSKAGKFALDAISRNLFNSRPASAMGDFFGGSISGHRHRRTKSTTSRSSSNTQTTTTGDGSMKFSSGSGSTAPTSILDEDELRFSSKSSRSKRSSSKRGKSTNGFVSEPEQDSITRKSSRSIQRSRSVSDWESESSDGDGDDDEGTVMMEHNIVPDSSDWNLTLQLELARRNSKNQHGRALPPLQIAGPSVEPVYEEDNDTLRPCSEEMDDLRSRHSTTPTTMHSRSPSRQSIERRPMGPRSPSPLPPRSPFSSSSSIALPSMDDDLAQESSMAPGPSTVATPTRSRTQIHPTNIPRSTRQTFSYSGMTEATPKASSSTAAQMVPSSVEPLSIKKKTSLRSSIANGSPTPARKVYSRGSPLSRSTAGRVASPRKVSPSIRKGKVSAVAATLSSNFVDPTEKYMRYAESTKEGIELSRRALKRIKLEVETIRSNSIQESDPYSRPSSPDKSVRQILPSQPATRDAQTRIAEMHMLIGRRNGDISPRKPRSAVFESTTRTPTSGGGIVPPNVDGFIRSVDVIMTDVEKHFSNASSDQDQLQDGLKQIGVELKTRCTEIDRTKLELQNSKRQCELVKSLLADATAEKEIMYEAFNEELDGMYNDINLPDDEAWVAISTDLRKTKEARNALSKENSQMKRRIAELESQQEEWAILLRAHGLIP